MVNGMKLSIAIVATWMAMNVPTSRPPVRCTSSTANIGHLRQRRPGARLDSASPSDTTAVSRM